MASVLATRKPWLRSTLLVSIENASANKDANGALVLPEACDALPEELVAADALASVVDRQPWELRRWSRMPFRLSRQVQAVEFKYPSKIASQRASKGPQEQEEEPCRCLLSDANHSVWATLAWSAVTACLQKNDYTTDAIYRMRGALFTIKSARFFVYENAQRPGQFRVTMHVDELVLVGGEQCETVMAPGVQRIKELQKDPSVTQALLADMKRDLNAACPAAVVSMDMTTDDSQNIDLITNKFTQDASWTKDSSPVDSAESSAPTQTKDITLTATNRLNEATFQLGFHDFDISMDQQKVLQKTVPQVPSRFLSSSSTETTGSTDATQHPSIHAVRFKRKTSPVRMTPPRPVKLLSLINKMERSVGKVAKDGTSAAAEASSCNSDTDEVVSDVDDAEPSLDLLDMITGDQPSSSIVGGAPSESGDLADTEVTTNRAPAVTAATQLYPAMDEDLCPTQALPSEAESHVAQTSDPVDIPCAQLVSISDENGSPLTYFPVKRVNEHIEDMNDSISGEQDSLAKSGEESSAGLTHVTFGPNYSQRSGQFVGTQDVITSDLDPQLTPIDGTQEPTDECVANRSRADLDDGDGDDEHSTSMVEPATTVNMDESGILPQTDSLEVPDDADFTPASEVLGVDDTSSSMVFEPTTSLCDAGSDQSDTDAGDERGVHELTSVNSPDDNLVLEDSRVMVASPPAVTTVMATPVTASNPTVEPNTIIYSSGLRDDDDDENSPSPDHGEQSVMHEDTSPAASEISTAESSAADARPSYSQLRLEPIASSSMASTAPIVLLEQQHYVTPSSTSFGVADSDRFQVSFAWGSSSAATTEEESSLRKEQTSQMDATQTKDENPAVSTPSPTRDAAAQTSQSLSEILSAYNSPTKKRFTRDDERVVEVVSPRKCRPRHEVVIEIPIRPQSTSPRAVATTAAPKKRKLVRTRDIGKDSGDKSANGLNTIDDLFCRDDSKLQRDVEDELSGDQEQCDPNVLAMSDY